MSLIIEDGTGVADANSYVTVQECRDYNSLRGRDLPVDDVETEQLIIQAMDYLETLNYIGDKVDPEQSLEWPRTDAVVDGVTLPSDKVPSKIRQAQCVLTFEAQSTVLQPTGDGREILKEKVDVLEVQYAETGSTVSVPTFTAVDALLEDYIDNGSGGTLTGAALTTVRV